jgi:hypothetical protein
MAAKAAYDTRDSVEPQKLLVVLREIYTMHRNTLKKRGKTGETGNGTEHIR